MNWKSIRIALHTAFAFLMSYIRRGRQGQRIVDASTVASIPLSQAGGNERVTTMTTMSESPSTPPPESDVPAPDWQTFAAWWKELNDYAHQYGTVFSIQEARKLYKRFPPQTPAPAQGKQESEGKE